MKQAHCYFSEKFFPRGNIKYHKIQTLRGNPSKDISEFC